MRKITAATLLALMATSAYAERTRPFYQASRALAMGDAFTAYDLGFAGVFYNPAGVARKSAPNIKLVDFELLGSKGMYEYLRSSITNLGQLSQIAQTVASNPDTVHAMGLTFLPQFIVKNFSIGLLARTYTEALVDSTTNNLDFYGYTDLALCAQWGVSLYGGIVKLGVGLKALDRAELERVYTPSEYASGLSFGSQWREGVGYGLDAGVLLTAPVRLLPSLGIAVLDVGDTTLRDRRLIFTGGSGRPGAPPSIKQKINIGTSITIKHQSGIKSTVTAETKDVQHITSGYQERIHLGYELDLNNEIFIRAGLNQGRYWTAGVGLHLGGTALEFATYGENLLVYSGSVRENRNFVGRYVFSF